MSWFTWQSNQGQKELRRPSTVQIRTVFEHFRQILTQERKLEFWNIWGVGGSAKGHIWSFEICVCVGGGGLEKVRFGLRKEN